MPNPNQSKLKAKLLPTLVGREPDPPEWELLRRDDSVAKNTEESVSPIPWLDIEVQVVTRQQRTEERGQLVDFAVMLQIRETADDAWVDVCRIDLAHGFIHIDEYEPGKATATKNENSVPSECRADIDKALVWALNYIWDTPTRLKGWV